jgi:hypothetical protein
MRGTKIVKKAVRKALLADLDREKIAVYYHVQDPGLMRKHRGEYTCEAVHGLCHRCPFSMASEKELIEGCYVDRPIRIALLAEGLWSTALWNGVDTVYTVIEAAFN